MWCGRDIHPEDSYLAKDIRCSRIPGVADISHKKVTGFYLNKFRLYYPDDYTFFPRTFLIPEEMDKLEKHMESNPKRMYIAKPTSGSHGDGIVLVKKKGDIPINKFTTTNPNMVIQEYIDKPLLVDKKKFDLRMYVLIAKVKPMIAFLNEEGLARFCTEDYEEPNKNNFKNGFMHLTNYNLNKTSDNYKYTEELYEINEGSKRTLTSLWKSIEKEGHDVGTIKENIKELMEWLLVCIQPYIQWSYDAVYSGKTKGKCFHVLGIDIMIDQDLKPWLLEINSNPSLSIEFDPEKDKMTTKKKTEVIISPIDLHVKSQVIEDAVLLAKKKIARLTEIQKYGKFEQIYHSDNTKYSQKEIFKNILKIYAHLSGAKFRESITSSRFVKISKIPELTCERFLKMDYDLIFQKYVRNSEDRKMDFAAFIFAIEAIAQKLHKDCDPENPQAEVQFVVDTIMRSFSLS